MNVLEQLRQRHHSTSTGGCSCGDRGPCDAATAVDIGLELLDAATLGMGDVLNMQRMLKSMQRRVERAVLLNEEFTEKGDDGASERST